MNSKEVAVLILAIAAVFGLLYGMFIYNHSQDLSRDKFLIEHCRAVDSDHNSAFTGSQTFTCKDLKK